MAVLKFPKDFLWGCATASYQIEGAPLEDGAGPSIWHTFSHQPNTIQDGDTGDVACDHYHRAAADVALMQELGLKAYRFSIAWPRIFPEGKGAPNPKGIAFYDRLVDTLLEAGIAPMPTLYHWDLPQAIEDVGGWPERDTAEWFADYAAEMFRALGDRVKCWLTFNEPWVFTYLGYGLGIHAPGRNDIGAALQAGHTVLRAHGLAVQRFRETVPEGEIGITLSTSGVQPASDDPLDQEAAERKWAFHNGWFIDPIMGGAYPRAMHDQFGDLMPAMSAEDAATMMQKIDFIGLNYYTRQVAAYEADGFFKTREVPSIGAHTAMGWEIYPAGLYLLLKEFHERYGLPLYVTENGCGFDEADETAHNETPDSNGRVNDVDRLRYLQSHFEMAHRALSEGVDLRGYMVWSFLDNFEWGFGYSKRFGIVRCDFDTLERTPKHSARWYQRVIAENGI